MATAPEAAMMDMPQEAAPNPFSDPNTMAVYDQMRQTVSPKEFSDEMFAGASQVDPEAMAQFRDELSQIDLSPEDLDMLNNMVDEILANPEQYAEVRAKYIEMGTPEELLPEQFDPQFFAAMNMAVEQLIGEPAGVQAFAQGGIAELKPIAKAIAGYGRNGDTMLAHITPAEARMLRRRGGSGTINPATGLPEFFLKKAFKSLGKAIKKFASSTVGRIVTTVALGFFLGPAAAAFAGVGATSVAGLAITGFVSGAGSTLLAGGNLKSALKAGAIGGLTAGALAGVSGASLTGTPSGLTPGQALSGQVDKFTGMFKAPSFPQYTAQGALTDNATSNAAREAYAGELYKTNPEAFYNPAPTPTAPLPGQPGSDVLIGGKPPIPPAPLPGQPGSDVLVGGKPPIPPLGATQAPYKVPTIGESFSKMGEGIGLGDGPASYKTFMEGAGDLFAPGPNNAQVTARAQEIMSTTPGATLKDAMAAASKELSPGFLRTYGPATVAGIGAIGAFGGFKPSDPSPSALKPELMKPVTQRIAEGGNQRAFYMQGLPGVKYDQYGAPIFGESSPLPTYEAPNFAGNYGGGITSLPNSQTYTPPPGVVGGNAPVYQPYNTASMYSNLIPRRYEAGGTVKAPTAEEKAAADKVAADKAAALAASQAANREAVRAQEQQQRAAGFGNAYANINAGLAYNAPSSMPAQVMAPERTAGIKQLLAKPNMTDAEIFAGMQKNSYTPAEVAQATGVSFGDINRRYNVAARQAQFDPAAQAAQYRTANEAALGFKPATAAPVAKPAAVSNVLTPAIAQDLMYRSMSPGGTPTSSFTQYGGFDTVSDMAKTAGFQPTPQWMNSYKPTNSGIASLAAGGYPRRTGQISGPGTATSDSIPAMLSDGEFVMTAKAVRGAGKGDRRAGAKRMYALMNQLEKNAARG
jgi:hypothetical protein